MKKQIISALISVSMVGASFVALADGDGVEYTFSGVNIITDGSTDEITDKPLTEDISVTTSGDMNRKYAAVTDLEHNNEVGTYPANADFKADGSYIYLATASSNDNTIITLNMPKIKAGSNVTITFAKPMVTNNGSTLRNTSDPYAYFKIGDRYISINGDNFDTWRTETVTLGEDSDTIEFHCDKWGAVAISSIEITDCDGVKLYDLNIQSNQYAKLNINGIRFNADENGRLTVPSLPEGETLKISAEKDGYIPSEKEVTIENSDVNTDFYLECENDSAYYESDFGNSAGTLSLNGEFSIGTEAEEITELSSNITFDENGEYRVEDGSGRSVLDMYYSDGIYVNGTYITPKDNMEFTAVFDKAENTVTVSQNGESYVIECDLSGFDKINSISGENTVFEYIGVSYPDMNAISIDGPDKVTVTELYDRTVKYNISTPYQRSETKIECAVSGTDGAEIDDTGMLTINAGTSGKVLITAKYNGAEAQKEVEIIPSPTIDEWSCNGNTLNLGSSEQLELTSCKDEFGEDVMYDLRDLKSSDENVIQVTDDGIIRAVGEGKATVTANAYTGADNIISVDYTVERFYIDGITESDTSYVKADISDNTNIIGYKISFADGTSQSAEATEIPAAKAADDGMMYTVMYDKNGVLSSVKCEEIKKDEEIPVSNGNKHIYLHSDSSFDEITEADTVMDGYEISKEPGIEYEISPVYKFSDIGDVKEAGKNMDGIFADGYYNITFKKAETMRGDIYVNGYMVGNNVDQADADRKVSEGALYTAEDIKINGGAVNVSMCDGSTMLDYVQIEKQPDFYKRPQRIYIIGDSLACEYYGDFEQKVGGGRSGWGQQLDDFVNVPVTNLANSGQYAAGLYETAFPSVIANGESGDILLIECGYNDRSYSTRDEMTECVKNMISQCRENGIIPVLVTPNASQHDYKPSVVWSSYLRDIAVDTDCEIIDLSEKSYEFLYSLYGEDTDQNITKNFNLTEVGGDNLHSSYAGAYKWASIVAQGLKDLGYGDIINTQFSYSFTDTLGNNITARVE